MPKNRWNCCQVELAFLANDIAVCGVVAVFMGFDGVGSAGCLLLEV